ncbi:hypothetical protein [Nocardia nova]|nr:hypothetical protein [Nocardia nova]
MDVAVWQLAERYWYRVLAAAPSEATQLGDHRFDDRIDDLSLAAERDYLTMSKALLLTRRQMFNAQREPVRVV